MDLTLDRKLAREVIALGLPTGPDPNVELGPVTEADLEPLPETASRSHEWQLLGRACLVFRTPTADVRLS